MVNMWQAKGHTQTLRPQTFLPTKSKYSCKILKILF